MIVKINPMKNSPNPPINDPKNIAAATANSENDSSTTEKVSPGVPSQSTE